MSISENRFPTFPGHALSERRACVIWTLATSVSPRVTLTPDKPYREDAMSNVTRRTTLAGMAAFAALPARAQTPWPERQITLVHGLAPGGPSDIIARIIAEDSHGGSASRWWSMHGRAPAAASRPGRSPAPRPTAIR